MNIPPNSQPISSNDPSIAPKDPTNAPIEKIPSEILRHIISFVDDKGIESAASTKKPLTKITIDQARQNSSNEIKEFVKGFSRLLDMIISKIGDENELIKEVPELLETNEKAIEAIKNAREEILAFGDRQVLGGVNLLDVKSSMMDAKIDLARFISKVFKIEGTQRVLSEEEFHDCIGTSYMAKDIMRLAECYLQIDEIERMPFEDRYAPNRLIEMLIDSGDLAEAFRIAAFNEEKPFNFYRELLERKIPESILDKIEMFVDTLSTSQFKTESLLFLIEKHLENENPNKSLTNLEKIPSDVHLIPKMYAYIRYIASKFVTIGNFEKAEKIINNLPDIEKSEYLKSFEKRKSDQAIIKEFAGKGSIKKYEVQSLLESIEKLESNEKKVSVYKAVFSELYWNQSKEELDAYGRNLNPEIEKIVYRHIFRLRRKYG